MGYGFKILIEGDYACFTRPEMKVERVSYDVPTPGALEGLLKSIYWKPAIRYVIDEIVVFNPIRFANIRRNEVKDKVSLTNVKRKMKAPTTDVSIYADESRNQRASMILKNVCYGVAFHFELTHLRDDHETEGEKKHYNILKRRLENGQCFRTPCLGCSEFPVKRLQIVENFDYAAVDASLRDAEDLDLGYMLYRMQFEDEGKPVKGDWENPVFSDRAHAVYYRPHLQKGVIRVAQYVEECLC